MKKVEAICRALCDFDGRAPDFTNYGIPAWHRYKSQARMILRAIKHRKSFKRSFLEAVRDE